MKIRKAVATLTATAALGVGAVALTASPAAAHGDWVATNPNSEQPVHEMHSCSWSNGAGLLTTACNRWILANGAVIQGPGSLMMDQYAYVLVRCSYRKYGGGVELNTAPFGPWNNTGYHTYCQNPKYWNAPPDSPIVQKPWSLWYHN